MKSITDTLNTFMALLPAGGTLVLAEGAPDLWWENRGKP